MEPAGTITKNLYPSPPGGRDQTCSLPLSRPDLLPRPSESLSPPSDPADPLGRKSVKLLFSSSSWGRGRQRHVDGVTPRETARASCTPHGHLWVRTGRREAAAALSPIARGARGLRQAPSGPTLRVTTQRGITGAPGNARAPPGRRSTPRRRATLARRRDAGGSFSMPPPEYASHGPGGRGAGRGKGGARGREGRRNPPIPRARRSPAPPSGATPCCTTRTCACEPLLPSPRDSRRRSWRDAGGGPSAGRGGSGDRRRSRERSRGRPRAEPARESLRASHFVTEPDRPVVRRVCRRATSVRAQRGATRPGMHLDGGPGQDGGRRRSESRIY